MSLLKNRSISEKTIAWVALFLPVLIWLWPLYLSKNLALFPEIDGAFYFYPMTKIGMDMFMHGQVPLWTSLIHCGFPLLADGQGALLYPLNLLFFFLLPAPIANNFCIIFQILLTTAFMYAFCRKLGATRMSSVVAAWLWVFLGPVSVSVGSPALNGLIWWPLLFLIAEYISARCDWRLVALTGIIMGFDWLSGFPQTTFYGIVGSSMFFMFRLGERHLGQWKSGIEPLCGWMVAGIIGAGIAAPQIMTTMEMSHFSVRAGGVDFAFSSLGSMFPSGVLSFFLPGWNSLLVYTLAGSNLHIGFICLAAALLTIRRKNMKALEVFLWFLFTSGCLLAMGKYTPLYKIVHLIPGFSFFRYPYRFLYWVSFAGAILTALGLDRLFFDSEKPHTEQRKMVAFLTGLTSIAVLGSIFGSVLFHHLRNIFLKIAESIVKKSMIGQAYKVQDQSYYSAKITRMMTDIASAISPWHSEFLFSCVIALCAAVVLFVWLRKGHSFRGVKIAIYVLVALNLITFLQRPFGPMAQTKDFKSFPLAALLSGKDGPFRLYNVNSPAEISSNTHYRKDRLDPNFNMLSNIDHVGVYSALGTSKYFDFMGPLGTVNLAFAVRAVPAESVLVQNRSILDLCNVRYIVNKNPMTVPGFQCVHQGDPFLYQNDQCLPRAFVVPRAITIKDDSTMLKQIHSPSFDPRAAVLIDSDTKSTIADSGIQSSATILKHESSHITMNAAGPGWLVFTETYYPGWHARVDGKDAPIYRGDYVFKTLPLAPGNHQIEFTFISEPFRYGLIILALTGFLVLIVFGWGQIKILRERRR